MDGELLPEQETEDIKNPSRVNISVHSGGILSKCILWGMKIYRIKSVSFRLSDVKKACNIKAFPTPEIIPTLVSDLDIGL